MTVQIAVLAVQGAFIEHEQTMRSLGAEVFELRQLRDLERRCDALILPGGESTVQSKLLKELKLFIPLKQLISNGLPVMATCAGAILLAEKIDNDPAVHFGTLPVTIRRNAFGRQLASFYTDGKFSRVPDPVPMPFIRAPQIISAADGVEILSSWQNQPTAVRYKNQLALTWHPEITGCGEIHRYFLENIVKKQG